MSGGGRPGEAGLLRDAADVEIRAIRVGESRVLESLADATLVVVDRRKVSVRRVGWENLVTPPGRTRERHGRDDHDTGYERHRMSTKPPAWSGDGPILRTGPMGFVVLPKCQDPDFCTLQPLPIVSHLSVDFPLRLERAPLRVLLVQDSPAPSSSAVADLPACCSAQPTLRPRY